MAQEKRKAGQSGLKELVQEDRALMKAPVHQAIQEFLEAETNAALQAERGERTPGRLGYRSGYYSRSLTTGWGRWDRFQLSRASKLALVFDSALTKGGQAELVTRRGGSSPFCRT
ncbi:MAG: transposase [Thermoanaerobaculia bacterium]|nr:transposase [Thermoanaerobaculia bacterium]